MFVVGGISLLLFDRRQSLYSTQSDRNRVQKEINHAKQAQLAPHKRPMQSMCLSATEILKRNLNTAGVVVVSRTGASSSEKENLTMKEKVEAAQFKFRFLSETGAFNNHLFA